MSLFITAYKNRTTKELITVSGLSSSGNVIQPSLPSGSKVRVKVGKSGHAPILDLVSGQVLSGGTKVTAENPAVLTICGQDFAAFAAGIYDIEAIIIDHADNDKTKIADEGIFVLQDTQGGNIG